jgi:hypothetical protein
MGSGLRDLRIIDGSNAHGTRLLDADMLTGLVDWFRRSLV